jgi:hypothetical protein
VTNQPLNNNSFAGKRAIAVGRYSSAGQTSMEKQIELIQHYAVKHGIEVIDELKLDAVSASLSKQEAHLRKLIDRKKTQNDFELVIFFEYGRFARKMTKGFQLWSEFEDAEIEVLSTTDNHYTGELAPIQRILELFKHESFVRSLAKHVTSSRLQAVKNKVITPVTNVMMGVDKLFIGSSGEKLFILRDTHGGYKEKLHPENLDLIERVKKVKGEKAVPKKKSERVVPVPGDPEHVKAVNDIFRWRLIENRKPWAICRSLSDRGIPTVCGTYWQPHTIKQILENTIYTGTAIGGRETTGTWVGIKKDGLEIHAKPREVPEGRSTIPPIFRDMDDWTIQPVPEMAEYLEPDIREIAKKWQWDRLKGKQDRRARRAANAALPKNKEGRQSGGNRHDPNRYPLSNIMRAKQDGHALSGTSVPDGENKRYRYYNICKFRHVPSMAGTIFRTNISAYAVEHSVYETIAETLSHVDGLDKRLAKHIDRYTRERMKDRHDLPTIEKERAEIGEKYRRLIENVGPLGLEFFQKEKEQLERRLAHLNARQKAAVSDMAVTPKDAPAVAASVKAQFATILKLMNEGAVNLRPLIEVFVSRCEVDLVTKDVELEFALPGWAITHKQKALEEVCVVGSAVASGSYSGQIQAFLLPDAA